MNTERQRIVSNPKPASYGINDLLEWAEELPPAASRPTVAERDLGVDQPRCDSRIEEMMLWSLHDCGFRLARDGASRSLGLLCPQKEIALPAFTAHVDFAILRKATPTRLVRIALELDGHNFHQRTKEQVTRDYRRGRELARAGWIVIRFTGSEIYRDAGACALEVSGILIDAVSRIREGR